MCSGGGLAGLSFIVTLVTLLKAMQTGPVAFTWILLNFAILIPIGVSWGLWSEPITSLQLFGLALFGACILLFGKGQSVTQASRPFTARYLTFAALMFIGNGACILLFKILSKGPTSGNVFAPFIYFYLVAGSLFLIYGVTRGMTTPARQELVVAGAAAVSAVVGNVFLYLAISIAAGPSLAIIHGLSVMAVSIGSAVLYKERFTGYSIAGSAAGVVSIVLLVL